MNPAVNKPREQRNASDYYPTPDALALAICEALRDRLNLDPGRVVEPSAGDGAFVRAARTTWGGTTLLLAVDPSPGPRLLAMRAGMRPAGDGLSIRESTWEDVQGSPGPGALILGNPPFSLWESHARLALERLPAGGHLAFLLRADVKSGQRRNREFWPAHPLRYEWPITPRPSFTGDGGTDGRDYSVFVWRKGHAGPCESSPLLWEPPPTTPEQRALRRQRAAESRARSIEKALAKATTEQLRAELERRSA